MSAREDGVGWGIALILLSAAGYGLVPIVTKIAFAAIPELEPLDLLGWRFLLATPLMWLFVLARMPRATGALFHRRGWYMGAAGLIYVGNASLTFLGLERIPASVFSLLFYMYPAMVAVLSVMLGESLPLGRWIAIGLALVGTALTVGTASTVMGADAVGLAMAVGTALCYTVYVVVSSRVGRGLARPVAGAWSLTGTTVGIMGITLSRGGLPMPPDIAAWMLILLLVAVGTIMPVVSFLVGLERIGPARAATVSTVEPLLTVVLAALFLSERITTVQAVGGALILCSVLWLQRPRRVPPAPPAAAARSDVDAPALG